MVNQLMEMFPYTCDLEVNHCLTVTGVNLERASQLIMHRHEGGQSFQPADRRVSKPGYIEGMVPLAGLECTFSIGENLILKYLAHVSSLFI